MYSIKYDIVYHIYKSNAFHIYIYTFLVSYTPCRLAMQCLIVLNIDRWVFLYHTKCARSCMSHIHLWAIWSTIHLLTYYHILVQYIILMLLHYAWFICLGPEPSIINLMMVLTLNKTKKKYIRRNSSTWKLISKSVALCAQREGILNVSLI